MLDLFDPFHFYLHFTHESEAFGVTHTPCAGEWDPRIDQKRER